MAAMLSFQLALVLSGTAPGARSFQIGGTTFYIEEKKNEVLIVTGRKPSERVYRAQKLEQGKSGVMIADVDNRLPGAEVCRFEKTSDEIDAKKFVKVYRWSIQKRVFVLAFQAIVSGAAEVLQSNLRQCSQAIGEIQNIQRQAKQAKGNPEYRKILLGLNAPEKWLIIQFQCENSYVATFAKTSGKDCTIVVVNGKFDNLSAGCSLSK